MNADEAATMSEWKGGKEVVWVVAGGRASVEASKHQARGSRLGGKQEAQGVACRVASRAKRAAQSHEAGKCGRRGRVSLLATESGAGSKERGRCGWLRG